MDVARGARRLGSWLRRGPIRAVPWGLVGMLALVLLVERQAARHALDLLDPDDFAFREVRRTAAREATRADVLVLGDSLAKFAVAPRIVERRSGLRVVNLALSGGQATTTEAVLRRALDAGARPKAIVLDVFPKLQSVGPRFALRRWASLLDPIAAARLAWSAGDPELFGSIAVARALPTIQARDGIRRGVLEGLAGRPASRAWANTLAVRHWSRNLGAHLVPASDAVANLSAEALDAWRRDYFGAFVCEPVNLRALERTLGLASSRGIQVYWLLPPYVPGLSDRCEASGFEAEHQAFVRGWQARDPNVSVIDARRAVADPRAYHDPHHLAAPGAHGFSLGLGDLLRRDLTGVAPSSRWLTLGPCPPRALPPDLEDLDGSRLALEAAARRSRR